MYAARSSAPEKSWLTFKVFRGFAPTALRPTPGRCRGSFSSGLLFQGLRPYGLTAYPRALSWFVFIGGPLKTWRDRRCRFYPATTTRCPVFFQGLRPYGLAPGVVVVRFHRGPLKTWRDRLRRFYPATTTRCPVSHLSCYVRSFIQVLPCLGLT